MKIENRILINFNEPRWKDTDLSELPNIINNLNENVKEGTLLGELFHDTYNDRSSIISLSNVSHKIDRLVLTDNIVIADIDILDTPSGKLVEWFLSNNWGKFYSRLNGISEPEKIMDIFTWDYIYSN